MNILTKEEKTLAKKYKDLSRLFKHFDIVPFAYHPGVKSFVPGHGSMNVEFDDTALKFIVPLLKELLKYRKYGEKFGIDFRSKKKWYKGKEVV